ncbi:MAG: hypothetical protein HQK65_07070 [Desulfamplus sp.]|nr:hypothetical protein [Desulfamplus sp.]
MFEDPIVDEVRAARMKHAARFNFDLKRIAQDLKEKQSKRKTVSYLPKLPGIKSSSIKTERTALNEE